MKIHRRHLTVIVTALAMSAVAAAPSAAAGQLVEADLCIYGGTSGGVMAAVQAARMGKSAVIVEPGRHVGGMTSGGLGRTDTGNVGTIGGLSREFYRRVGQHYGVTESFTFEPHVAEQVFLDLLREVKVPVHFRQRLTGVTREGPRLTSLLTANGDEFRARMFLDATYEGDLLALAGVSFTVGRESSAAFGESLNGIRANTPSHQFLVPVDPYVIPGDPNSGLLPFIQPGDGGAPGEGDHRVQAYNFRLCLTQVETNRLPIEPPADYDPARYELLGRYLQARVTNGHSLTLGSFLNIATMPNGKTDLNNNGAFSTDFIGMNYTYPTNTVAERARLWQEHENYTRGFLTFLATDARVPPAVRASLQSWGLCRDEFQDTGGWPHQLYVREARRMVSDYVITQADCDGLWVASDSVGLASYNMDSHNCQRIVKNAAVTNEGDVQRPPAGPFPISYRAIVPKAGECQNLFATFCLSGTHIAFSSCRMEPVFMMTSQSAAAAASFAIDDDLAVQDVPYGRLRLQLIADHQVLQWGGTTVTPEGIVLDTEQPLGVTITGSWTASTSVSGYLGANYLHDQNTGKGAKSVRFTPDLPGAGTYTVYLRWTTNPNRASNVPITLTYEGGVTNFTVNQQINHGVWVALATLPFAAGTSGNLLLETTGTDGYVIADGALWSPAAEPAPPSVEVIASDATADEDGPNPAVFTLVRSEVAGTALNVRYSLSGAAVPGEDYPANSGVAVIPPGQIATAIRILPLADSLPEGDESITLTLTTNAGYRLGDYTQAGAILRDGGFGKWRGDQFTPLELTDPAISGAAADPDADSIVNLLEFFLGSDPKSPNQAARVRLVPESTNWHLDWQRAREAADLFLRLEESADLADWRPAPFSAQIPLVTDLPPWQALRFPLGNPMTNSGSGFYRVVVSETPLALATSTARFFFSFDTAPDGSNAFTAEVTASDGFAGTPTIARLGTVLADAGGAGSFTDFTGTTWLGSGGAAVPGHSLSFNPGSTGNQFSLTFSTLGLRKLRLRMDLRSAAQPGGSAPTAFSILTFDVGGGPEPVSGVDLGLVADNLFHEWSADLSALTVLDNQRSVTLAWSVPDLASSPAVSFRADNLQVSAEPLSAPARP